MDWHWDNAKTEMTTYTSSSSNRIDSIITLCCPQIEKYFLYFSIPLHYLHPHSWNPWSTGCTGIHIQRRTGTHWPDSRGPEGWLLHPAELLLHTPAEWSWPQAGWRWSWQRGAWTQKKVEIQVLSCICSDLYLYCILCYKYTICWLVHKWGLIKPFHYKN